MKYLALMFLTACAVVQDPVIYKDGVELIEEVVKDEVAGSSDPRRPRGVKLWIAHF